MIATFDAVLLMLPVMLYAARGIVRPESAPIAPGLAAVAPMLLIRHVMCEQNARDHERRARAAALP